jgi:hypothetical protein
MVLVKKIVSIDFMCGGSLALDALALARMLRALARRAVGDLEVVVGGTCAGKQLCRDCHYIVITLSLHGGHHMHPEMLLTLSMVLHHLLRCVHTQIDVRTAL